MRSLTSLALLFTTALVAPAVADDAVRTAAPLPASKLIRLPGSVAGEYIVVLKGEPPARLALAARASADAAIDRLSTTHNVSVTERYSAALRGFSARMTDADALALAADPDVAFVEENGVVHGDAIQQDPQWGLDRIDQQNLPLDKRYAGLGDGAGVTIYMIDSGIRPTHSEFTGRIQGGIFAINDGREVTDCHGHGTHTTGTAAGSTYGIAKKAKIVPVRVLDCTNAGTLTGIIAGIDAITKSHPTPSIASMSIGSKPASEAVDLAVRNLIQSGVTTIVSSGNSTEDACLQSPAREPLAITVGSTTITDARSGFSNFGTCVDLHAPGTDILSAGFEGDNATKTLSGTSMATPHVTGVAALYLGQHPTATPAQVGKALLDAATRDKVTDVRGSPNLLLNAAYLDEAAPVAAIRSPADGARVPQSFAVEVGATDANLATVEISVDGTVAQTAETADPSFQLADLAEGAHAIAITVTDFANKKTTSSINVTVAKSAAPAPNPGGGGEEPGGGEVGGGCSAGGAGSLGVQVSLLALALADAMRRRRRAVRSAR